MVLDATGHARTLVEFDEKFDPGYQVSTHAQVLSAETSCCMLAIMGSATALLAARPFRPWLITTCLVTPLCASRGDAAPHVACTVASACSCQPSQLHSQKQPMTSTVQHCLAET